MIVFEGVPLLVLLITTDIISSSVIEKRTFDVKPWQSFEPAMAIAENRVRASPKGIFIFVTILISYVNWLLLHFMLCVMPIVNFLGFCQFILLLSDMSFTVTISLN